jgi:hypothetical protein
MFGSRMYRRIFGLRREARRHVEICDYINLDVDTRIRIL